MVPEGTIVIESRTPRVPGIRWVVCVRGINTYKRIRIPVHARAQCSRVNKSEHSSADPNAEGQCNDDNRRKEGVLAQVSNSETNVTLQALDQNDGARVPTFFLGALDSAELNASAPHSLFARNPSQHQVFCACLDMKAQLRVHLPFHPRTAESCLQPRPKPAPKRHTSSGLVPKIPAMTSAMRFQFSASACSLRFPAAVSR